ncbi:MAG TPA: NAD(P)H-binding protein [Candidatus Saccharimonadales bacterium]|nr:NAD(P)H-binding protein [Candidatus Saccharimonadales bacterium]
MRITIFGASGKVGRLVAEGDSLGLIHRLTHTAIRLGPGRKILADSERHISLLEQSGLDWTVVRSPIMAKRGDAMRFRLTYDRPMPWATINRHSVAAAMLRLVEDRKYSGRAPFIVRK